MTTAAWAPTDPLGDALHLLRMSGVFYARSEVTAPWGIEVPPLGDLLFFHVVVSGECWLDVEGAESRVLRPGDLALVPHGKGHLLLSEPGIATVPLFDIPRELATERYEMLRHGGGGAPTTLICGVVRFDHPAARHLVQLLPKLLLVEHRASLHAGWMQSTLQLMAAEAMELRPGGETVITRLADILIIQAIRAWIEEDPAAQTGWLGALQDRQIGPAIALIHRYPERDWSVATLAAEVAMSRSAFAARFTALVGEPAMQYVTRWRMHVALTWLRDDGGTLGEIAFRLGYQSEAAFSRAFKRCIGVSPGAARHAPTAEEWLATLPEYPARRSS